MDLVAFISWETGDDLIVSFAVCHPHDPAEILSLTLLRTPKYEMFLYEWERGVSVSFEAEEESDDDERVLLREVRYAAAEKVVTVRTDKATYELDVRKVSPNELKQMRRVLRKMNFDSSIKLEGM